MRRVAILCVRCYRYCISPFMAAHCRFYPSCSEYAEQAFQRHGIIKGLWITVKRLSRCHPWHQGGYDPVPEKGKVKHVHG